FPKGSLRDNFYESMIQTLKINKMKTIVTSSFKETQEMGFDFAKNLKGGDVLALYGDLGSGKTTFVQGLAKGLGIERPIISPTFIIMRTYQVGTVDKGLGIRNFYHVDLYRINEANDVQSLGLLDLLNQPEKRINIYFEYLGEDKREIRINY